jgi:hypothetical protein
MLEMASTRICVSWIKFFGQAVRPAKVSFTNIDVPDAAVTQQKSYAKGR